MAANNARMADLSLLLQAGINPKTKLPVKFGDPTLANLKPDIKRILRIVDEQDAVNRYHWDNLPSGITSQELERMIYYKGQLCFFYFPELDRFFFMPYALDGTIDFYGRFNTIHPVPYTDGSEKTDSDEFKRKSDLLSAMKLDVQYDVVDLAEEITYDKLTKTAVLLHDYTKQNGQLITSRQIVNDPLLDVEAEMIPFLRTALIAATGIKGVRVGDADQSQNVAEGSRSMVNGALKGDPWIPIVGNLDFQELTNNAAGSADQFLLAMQSIDNLRLSTMGLENGGLFEKKAHLLQTENDVNQANVGLVLNDGLLIRQHFCDIVNSLWGLSMWVEPSESVLDVDIDGDGVAYDREDDNASLDGDYNNNDEESASEEEAAE